MSEGRGNVIRTMQDDEEEGAGRVEGRQEKAREGEGGKSNSPKRLRRRGKR